MLNQMNIYWQESDETGKEAPLFKLDRQNLQTGQVVFEMTTPPKINIEPENWWLEDYFPFGMAYFQVPC